MGFASVEHDLSRRSQSAYFAARLYLLLDMLAWWLIRAARDKLSALARSGASSKLLAEATSPARCWYVDSRLVLAVGRTAVLCEENHLIARGPD